MNWLLRIAFVLFATNAYAQNPTCPTRPSTDSSNACANTSFVQGLVRNPPAAIVLPNGSTATTQPNTDSSTLVSTTAFAQNILKQSTGFVYNIIGDGSTINNTNMQAALTAQAGGGQIHLGCGIYRLTAAMAVTVAANAHLEFSGSGPDCTVLQIEGNLTAFTFTFGGIYSSVTVRDMTITTDQVGVGTGLKFSQTIVNTDPAISGMSRIENVNFISSGGRLGGKYFATMIEIQNVSNVTMRNIQCIGLTTSNGGTCIFLNGLPASSGIGAIYYIENVQALAVNIGVYINDYVQGVTITGSNFTSGGYGIAMNGGATGLIDQVFITNNQFGNNSNYDIVLSASAAHMIHAQLTGNYFIAGRPTFGAASGVYLTGAYATVVGNTWLETVATTTPMLTLAGTGYTVANNIFIGGTTGSDIAIQANGSDMTIVGNTIKAFTSGIIFGNGAATSMAANNNMILNTNDYTVPAAGSLYIADPKPRLIANLFTCNATNPGSTANVVNANAPVYGAAFVGAGTTAAIALCNGAGGWVAH